jgi:hypothetical protein
MASADSIAAMIFFKLLLVCLDCRDALADVFCRECVAGVCEFEEPDILYRHALVSLGAAGEDAEVHGGDSCFPVGRGGGK